MRQPWTLCLDFRYKATIKSLEPIVFRENTTPIAFVFFIHNVHCTYHCYASVLITFLERLTRDNEQDNHRKTIF